MSIAEQLATARRDADYYKREALNAFKARDEAVRSLQAAGGPAVFWRDQAKAVSKKLGDQHRLVGGLRNEANEQLQRAIGFSEQVDELRGRMDTTRRQLWDVWSGLADDDPMKRTLHDIWTGLA